MSYNHRSENSGEMVKPQRSHSTHLNFYGGKNAPKASEQNIIDLDDDDDDKKTRENSPQRSKSQRMKNSSEHSKSRRLSKYLSKPRKSIAAFSTELLGESGRDALKLFSKHRNSVPRVSLDDDEKCESKDESLDEDYDGVASSCSSVADSKSKKDASSRRDSISSLFHDDLEIPEDDEYPLDGFMTPKFGIDNCENYTLDRTQRSSLTHAIHFDLHFKVILIGDSGVGKTCFLIMYKDRTFLTGSFISTIGVDFRNKVITVDNSKVKLQIWDTAGQERFRSVTHAYYRDAHALLLLYDVGNKPSFDNTREWLAEVHEYAKDDVVIMLIGNKCDIPPLDRQIRREDGERLAREYNVSFMETSAKNGLNVDLAFKAVARELKARKSSCPTEKKFNVSEYVEKEEKTNFQCTGCNL